MSETSTVLIIVDLQKDFFKEGRLKQLKNSIVRETNKLVALARKTNTPIIWTYLKFKADNSDAFPSLSKAGIKYNLENTDGWELLDELDYRDEDTFLLKKRYSSFFGTNLDELLEKYNTNQVVISGVNTHACVMVTAIDAYQRDLNVILASDCTNSYNKDRHESIWKYMTSKLGQGIYNIATPLSNDEIAKVFLK